MSARVSHYIAAYVAARRTERQIARHETEWNRWAARAQLARTIGDEQLAAVARERALAHGEAAARLRMQHAEQSAVAHHLEALVRREKSAVQ